MRKHHTQIYGEKDFQYMEKCRQNKAAYSCIMEDSRQNKVDFFSIVEKIAKIILCSLIFVSIHARTRVCTYVHIPLPLVEKRVVCCSTFATRVLR